MYTTVIKRSQTRPNIRYRKYKEARKQQQATNQDILTITISIVNQKNIYVHKC